MTRNTFVWLLATMLLTTASIARAQQSGKFPRIGFLFVSSLSSNSARIEAFHQGLRDLGYSEGKNIAIEWRSAEGRPDRVPALAVELARLKVDVIVTAGPADTRAARGATTTIPMVMAQDSDPVATGVVSSLARPGANITGLATLSPEISGKQLEPLKAIVSRLSLVAVLGTSTIPGSTQAFRETESAAAALGIKLHYLDVPGPNDIEAAFRAATKQRADAVLVLGSPVLNSQRAQVVKLAEKNRLPAAYTRPEFVEAGGLMTYGASYNDLYRRAAIYVDKILKGAKPADLPVEQPTKFELVINLKAAKQISLTMPPSVLARADKVIK